MVPTMDCLFCKIVEKQLPCKLVFENEQVLAFEDIQPQAPTHILVIPKQHIDGIYDATETDAATLAALLLTAKDIAQSLGLDTTGYRFVMNSKHDGGQTVNHIHLHLLGGRKMTWPPG